MRLSARLRQSSARDAGVAFAGAGGGLGQGIIIIIIIISSSSNNNNNNNYHYYYTVRAGNMSPDRQAEAARAQLDPKGSLRGEITQRRTVRDKSRENTAPPLCGSPRTIGYVDLFL